MKVWIPVKEFSSANRIVHHLSAFAFVTALALMMYDSYAGSSEAMKLHQSFGMTVFFLYFGRVVLMAWFGKPEGLGTKFEKFVAHMAHMALYAILLLMPISGFLINLARARETVVFNLFTIPGFEERNMGLYIMALDFHSFLEIACYVLLAAHISASFFHHYILKDDTLRRMWGKLK